MQIAALILGIVGGLWGLAIGVTSLVAEMRWAEFWEESVAMATVGQIVAIIIFSIVAIVAASLVRRRSTLAGILMLVTVLAYFLVGLKKNSKVDCINLKTGLFKVEKWTLVHSSKKGGIKWTRFTSG